MTKRLKEYTSHALSFVIYVWGLAMSRLTKITMAMIPAEQRAMDMTVRLQRTRMEVATFTFDLGLPRHEEPHPDPTNFASLQHDDHWHYIPAWVAIDPLIMSLHSVVAQKRQEQMDEEAIENIANEASDFLATQNGDKQ